MSRKSGLLYFSNNSGGPFLPGPFFHNNNRQLQSFDYTIIIQCYRFQGYAKYSKPHTAQKMSEYGEFFWSVFSRIWNRYGSLQSKSPYQSKGRKYGPEKTPHLDTFYAVIFDPCYHGIVL